MIKGDGRAVSIPKGLILGTLSAAVWTVLNMSFVAFLVSKEIISYQSYFFL